MFEQLSILFPAKIETLQEGEQFATGNRNDPFEVREHFNDAHAETKAFSMNDCRKLIFIPHGTLVYPVTKNK